MLFFQVQHNLFQSCIAATDKISETKSSSEPFEPLYYVTAEQEDECLSNSDIKAHLLAVESFPSNSVNGKPRFYEIRSIQQEEELDKEVGYYITKYEESHARFNFFSQPLLCLAPEAYFSIVRYMSIVGSISEVCWLTIIHVPPEERAMRQRGIRCWAAYVNFTFNLF